MNGMEYALRYVVRVLGGTMDDYPEAGIRPEQLLAMWNLACEVDDRAGMGVMDEMYGSVTPTELPPIVEEVTSPDVSAPFGWGPEIRRGES